MDLGVRPARDLLAPAPHAVAQALSRALATIVARSSTAGVSTSSNQSARHPAFEQPLQPPARAEARQPARSASSSKIPRWSSRSTRAKSAEGPRSDIVRPRRRAPPPRGRRRREAAAEPADQPAGPERTDVGLQLDERLDVPVRALRQRFADPVDPVGRVELAFEPVRLRHRQEAVGGGDQALGGVAQRRVLRRRDRSRSSRRPRASRAPETGRPSRSGAARGRAASRAGCRRRSATTRFCAGKTYPAIAAGTSSTERARASPRKVESWSPGC